MDVDGNWDGDYAKFSAEVIKKMLSSQKNANIHYHGCEGCENITECNIVDCIYSKMLTRKCPNCRKAEDFR